MKEKQDCIKKVKEKLKKNLNILIKVFKNTIILCSSSYFLMFLYI